MRGLLHWKFESFGKRLMLVEFCLYFAWLLGLSLSLLLLPGRESEQSQAETCALFRDYDGSWGRTRMVFEIGTLVLQVPTPGNMCVIRT